MLWVYGHYKYFNYFSARIDFFRQILTAPMLEGQNDSGLDLRLAGYCLQF